MVKYRFISFMVFSFTVAIAFFASCEAENDMPDPEKDPVEVRLVLGIENPVGVPVTRSLPEADMRDGVVLSYNDNSVKTKTGNEEAVNNLYILQFDNTGNDASDKLLTKESIDVNSIMKTTDSGGESMYTLNALLKETTNCHLFLIANEDPSLFNSFLVGQSTVENYKVYEQKLSSKEMDQVREGERNPMTGYYAGSLRAPDITIWLTRLMAKLTLTVAFDKLPAAYGLKLNSVQMQSIPALYMYYGVNTEYPKTNSTFVDYALQGETAGIRSGTTYTWYMPENLRGLNNAISDQKLKWKEQEPSWMNTGKSYATRVVLKGTCLISGVNKDITFTIYPGGNNIDDFNIRRNMFYNMTVDIRNLINGDKRIEY